MRHYLLSVYQPDGPPPEPAVLDPIMRDIAAVEQEMKDAGVRWLFVSTAAQLEKMRQVRGELPDLEGVVVFDATAAGADAISWSEFLQRGRQSLPLLASEMARRSKALGPEDLATIMYTSGTTGEPKGVMLTHANILSNVAASPKLTPELQSQVDLDSINFVSNDQLREVMQQTTATPQQVEEAVRVNTEARLRALKIGLLIMAGLALITIIPAGGLPNYVPGEVPDDQQPSKGQGGKT